MPTVEDLRVVLRDVATTEAGDSAAMLALLLDPPGPVSIGPRVRRQRLVSLAPLAAIVVVVGVVLGALALTRGGGSSGVGARLVPEALPVDGYVFGVGPLPDGWRLVYTDSDSDQQDAMVVDSTGTDLAWVDVYAKSAAVGLATTQPGASSVEVNGQEGYSLPALKAGEPTPSPVGGTPIADSIVWQDPSGLWVNVSPYSHQNEDGRIVKAPIGSGQLLTIARAVTIPGVSASSAPALTVVSPAKLMVKFSYLPGVYRLGNVDEQQGADGLSTFGLISVDSPPAELGIGVGVLRPGDASEVTPGSQTISVAGFAGTSSPALISVTNGTITLTITINVPIGSPPRSAPVSLDQLGRILSGLTIASDPDDRSTWFDAATAIPN